MILRLTVTQLPLLQPGQVVCVLGSCVELGAWEPAGFLRLSRERADFWALEVEIVSLVETVEFKFVLVDSEGLVCQWEPGCRRRHSLWVQDGGDVCRVNCLWGHTRATTSSAPSSLVPSQATSPPTVAMTVVDSDNETDDDGGDGRTQERSCGRRSAPSVSMSPSGAVTPPSSPDSSRRLPPLALTPDRACLVKARHQAHHRRRRLGGSHHTHSNNHSRQGRPGHRQHHHNAKLNHHPAPHHHSLVPTHMDTRSEDEEMLGMEDEDSEFVEEEERRLALEGRVVVPNLGWDVDEDVAAAAECWSIGSDDVFDNTQAVPALAAKRFLAVPSGLSGAQDKEPLSLSSWCSQQLSASSANLDALGLGVASDSAAMMSGGGGSSSLCGLLGYHTAEPVNLQPKRSPFSGLTLAEAPAPLARSLPNLARLNITSRDDDFGCGGSGFGGGLNCGGSLKRRSQPFAGSLAPASSTTATTATSLCSSPIGAAFSDPSFHFQRSASFTVPRS